MASFPRAAEGELALVRGHCRLIDKPACSAVTVGNILARSARTLGRMRGQQTVLLVQDGTDLNFAEHSEDKGLGLIGKNQHSQGSVGLRVHSTLAISERGLPLGVTRVDFDRAGLDGQPERAKPLEERKTGRWLRGLRDSAELVAGMRGRPQVVAVLDREGHAFALFREQARLEGVQLLTTCAVDSHADAERVLGWYRQRWRIEDWHRVLKSGCKLESLQHRSAEHIERAVAIRAVIAWRLMAMTLLGRQTPELPAQLLFTEVELLMLRDFARDRKLPEPDNVGQAVRTMAMMGGYLNRKGAPHPGHQKLWEGHIDLAAEARCYGWVLRMGEGSLLLRKLSGD